jgi:hypothetical protein
MYYNNYYMLCLHLLYHSSISPGTPVETQSFNQVSMAAIRALGPSNPELSFSLSFETIKSWISSVLETIRNWLFGASASSSAVVESDRERFDTASDQLLEQGSDVIATPALPLTSANLALLAQTTYETPTHTSIEGSGSTSTQNLGTPSEGVEGRDRFMTANDQLLPGDLEEDDAASVSSGGTFVTALTDGGRSRHESTVGFNHDDPEATQDPVPTAPLPFAPTSVTRTPREEFESTIIQALGDAAGRALLERVFNQPVQTFSQEVDQYAVEFTQIQKRNFRPGTMMEKNTANSIQTPKRLVFTVRGHTISFAEVSPLIFNASVRPSKWIPAISADISIQSLTHNPSERSMTLQGSAMGQIKTIANPEAAFVQMINAII